MAETQNPKRKKLNVNTGNKEAQFEKSFQDKHPEDVKALNVTIPAELHNKLKKLAVDRGEPMREIIAQWIREA